MSSYIDTNRKLQDAVRSYLTTNLAIYESGEASALPVLVGVSFEDLGRDHCLVYVPEMREAPAYSGTYDASLVVRVATLRDTTDATHRTYCKAVFDLMCDSDLPTYLSQITGNKIRVNQVVEGRSFSAGMVGDSMRHDTLNIELKVYQVT